MQSEIPNDIMETAKAVVDRMPTHAFKGDCVADVAQAIMAHAALRSVSPVSRRNEDAGYVEFLNEDMPYIVRDIQGSVSILTDLKTRNVIGYRVYDPNYALTAQVQDVATAREFADRMFKLSGFMLSEEYRGKPAVTITFPDSAERNQFYSAIVELSTHKTSSTQEGVA